MPMSLNSQMLSALKAALVAMNDMGVENEATAGVFAKVRTAIRRADPRWQEPVPYPMDGGR